MIVLSRLSDVINDMPRKLDLVREKGLDYWITELATLHALQVQAQALLDMILRPASELGYRPESPGEAARHLLEEGFLTMEEYDFVRRIIGLQDIIVHGYATVDMDLVERVIRNGEYRRLARLAGNLLEKAVEYGLDP